MKKEAEAMIKDRKTNAGTAIVTFAAIMLLMVLYAQAGPLEPPGPPTGTGSEDSALYTLEDLYYRLDTGDNGTKRTGGFAGPTSELGQTETHTLNDIMELMPRADNDNGAKP